MLPRLVNDSDAAADCQWPQYESISNFYLEVVPSSGWMNTSKKDSLAHLL
eukprot:m.352419 g.352419  ORF g.352419 m.352419 type:complete len:50 (-) comp16583_c0_seq7:2153-2302(-)